MVLDSKVTKTISDFVRTKPRTIQEVSVHIKKNWRTAERYVEKIEQETGNISARIFREGTRGALKIVYWNSVENVQSTSFQEELFHQMMTEKFDYDFTPLDIYQHVTENKKKLMVEKNVKDPEIDVTESQDLVGFLRKTKNQLIIFSGNLSWINAKQGNKKIIDILRELVKKGVSIKIIARVSLVGMENSERLLSINKEVGKDLIEIRHRYQPVRAMIIDDKVIRFREIKVPEFYKHGELSKLIGIFYDIHDKEWVEWMEKVFWKMFSVSIPAEKRMKEIDIIRKKVMN